jgi:hypothetical protein
MSPWPEKLSFRGANWRWLEAAMDGLRYGKVPAARYPQTGIIGLMGHETPRMPLMRCREVCLFLAALGPRVLRSIHTQRARMTVLRLVRGEKRKSCTRCRWIMYGSIVSKVSIKLQRSVRRLMQKHFIVLGV